MEIVSRGARYRGKWDDNRIDWSGTFENIVSDVVGPTLLVAIVLFVLYCAAAGITYATRPSHNVWYSSHDYIRAAGITPDRHYHLRLGAPAGGGAVGSSQTTTSTDFFLFIGNTTTTTTGEITPSSSVRLGFRKGKTSYILEVPYSKVRFHQETGVKSWVRFAVWVYNDLDKMVQHNVGANFWTFSRGHISTKPVRIQDTPEWYYRVQDLGLSGYLNKYLAWVDLHLTPAQYNAYLGSLQTAKG
ncbi:MAG: hypothetical protein JWO96_546 [Candidatus Saccharibacteria bacterium]|nr:hypothetical protein [Candidatus Saccharibacteria bacterium]